MRRFCLVSHRARHQKIMHRQVASASFDFGAKLNSNQITNQMDGDKKHALTKKRFTGLKKRKGFAPHAFQVSMSISLIR